MAQGVPSADAAPGSPRCRRCPSCSPRSWATTRSAPCSAPPWPSCPPGTPPTSPAHLLPSLISAPFQQGRDIAFELAIAACLVAAVASLLRGRRYVHEEQEAVVAAAEVESGNAWKVARLGASAYAIRPP